MRNVAIVAHVDHGKTTLLDCMLKACLPADHKKENQAEDGDNRERVMDHNPLEKERGITIVSKVTALKHSSTAINIVDTPGHADFGGEVERVLDMVDGVLLVVDAYEGVMAQTKAVARKAIGLNLLPVLVLNKVDRPGADEARCGEVESDVFDMLDTMGATEEQLDFPTLYCSAKNGWCVREHPGDTVPSANMQPLFDALISRIPPPRCAPGAVDSPMSMLVTMVGHDEHLGVSVTGRLYTGSASEGVAVQALRGSEVLSANMKVIKIERTSGGLNKQRLGADESILAGDIVTFMLGHSAEMVRPGDTIAAAKSDVQAIPPPRVDPPTVSVTMKPSSSPLAGREGTKFSAADIGKRLRAEARTNPAIELEVIYAGADKSKELGVEVRARGELQLGVLLEQMRREGFEVDVTPPRVLTSVGDDGETITEPWERVVVDVDTEYGGAIIAAMSDRGGTLEEMTGSASGTTQRLAFLAASRSLFGLSRSLAEASKGTAIASREVHEWRPRSAVTVADSAKPALVSMADGKITAHALSALEARGKLFVIPGEDTFKGMVVGTYNKGGDKDLEVNPVREKKLTNIRAANNDENIKLTPVIPLNLEEVLGTLRADETVEVTPSKLRIRKV